MAICDNYEPSQFVFCSPTFSISTTCRWRRHDTDKDFIHSSSFLQQRCQNTRILFILYVIGGSTLRFSTLLVNKTDDDESLSLFRNRSCMRGGDAFLHCCCLVNFCLSFPKHGTHPRVDSAVDDVRFRRSVGEGDEEAIIMVASGSHVESLDCNLIYHERKLKSLCLI